MPEYNRGDVIVYAKQKWSASPEPHARAVSAMPSGDMYSYVVDKFWRVIGKEDEGVLRVRTRTGKEHWVAEGDQNLRRSNLFERILMRNRIPG